jgi:REP element-mobilizing transposase RayT
MTGVAVYAYCVMPDHVHLVIEPSPDCDLVTFVGQFKNLAQRAAWALGVEGAFWQKGFFDHFLRREEQLERVVAYVVENPVRRGLVETWQDYPFAGSLVFEL